MKIIRDRLFFLGTADDELYLGIAFPQIDRADDRVANTVGQRAAPHVDAASVHGCGVFDIAVIELILDLGVSRMGAALWPVDDDLTGRNKLVPGLPKMNVLFHNFTYCFFALTKRKFGL